MISEAEIRALLVMGGFEDAPFSSAMQRRFAPNMGVKDRVIRATFGPGVEFNLQPAISDHSFANHLAAAVPATIAFHLAQIIAERSDVATITQHALRGACLQEIAGEYATTMTHSHVARILATYPFAPLRHEHLCLGFRQALVNGIDQVWIGERQWES